MKWRFGQYQNLTITTGVLEQYYFVKHTPVSLVIVSTTKYDVVIKHAIPLEALRVGAKIIQELAKLAATNPNDWKRLHKMIMKALRNNWTFKINGCDMGSTIANSLYIRAYQQATVVRDKQRKEEICQIQAGTDT